MGIKLHDYQTTIKSRVTLSGFGVHSGKPVSITFLPADPDTGVVFHHIDDRRRTVKSGAGLGDRRHRSLHRARRSGRPSRRHCRACHGRAVRARHRQCRRRGRRQRDADPRRQRRRFVEAIDQAGIETLDVKRRYIRVVKPVRIESGASWAEFRPMTAPASRSRSTSRARPSAARPSPADISPGIFRREIARARTFGFMKDVERLWAAGYALGSSLENSVVIGDDSRVINMEGLRYKDEFVAPQDCSTPWATWRSRARASSAASAPIRGGHRLNAAALRHLLSDRSAFEIVETNRRAARPVGRTDRGQCGRSTRPGCSEPGAFDRPGASACPEPHAGFFRQRFVSEAVP